VIVCAYFWFLELLSISIAFREHETPIAFSHRPPNEFGGHQEDAQKFFITIVWLDFLISIQAHGFGNIYIFTYIHKYYNQFLN
jgi:hypothetical protein